MQPLPQWIREYFYHPQPPYPVPVSSHSPFPPRQPPGTANLLPASMALPLLRISRQRNQATESPCDRLLSCFPRVFDVRPRCSPSGLHSSMAEWCPAAWTGRVLLIHSPAGGCEGCFHFLAVTSDADLLPLRSYRMRGTCGRVFTSLGSHTGVGLLAHVAAPRSTRGTARLPPTAAAPFYLPTTSEGPDPRSLSPQPSMDTEQVHRQRDGGAQPPAFAPMAQDMLLEVEGQDKGVPRCGVGLARGHLGPGRLQPQTCSGGPSELLPTGVSVMGGGGQHMVSPGDPAQTGGRRAPSSLASVGPSNPR